MSYIGSTPTTQSFIAGTDYFNGTGSAVSFTMSRAVNSVNDIEVIVNNVEQIPSGYSVSGTTLTFSVAPSSGTSNVYVRYLSTTNLSLAIPAGTSATFNTVAATTLSVTGVTTFAAGTAALPAITTTGDTNTGIFFPAADTIAFAEGGVESMRINSSGNLLVGTTTAQTGAKLAVTGGIQGTIASGTAVASTSGTSIDFTSIPSWVKRITVMLRGVSTNGTSIPIIQLGDSGGIETSGYAGSTWLANTANSLHSSGFSLDASHSAAYVLEGLVVFSLCDLATNTWVGAFNGGLTNVATALTGAGSKSLSATLDRVRITTVNGTDTFDAGTINILYEG